MVTTEQLAQWRGMLTLHDNGSGCRVGTISGDDARRLLSIALPALLDEVERLIVMVAKPCYDCPQPEKRIVFHRLWEQVDADNAALRAENERLRALLREWDDKCAGHCDTESIAEQVEALK